MSGGLWEYKDEELKDTIFGWNGERRASNVFEDLEISELVFDVLELMHDFDFYKCGDTSKEYYEKCKEEFKRKWFCDANTRVKRTIDDSLEKARADLYQTYEIKEVKEEKK